MILTISTIIAIFAIALLVALDKIKSRWYWLCIWGMSIGLVYQTTLPGAGLVGTDIAKEHAASLYALQHGWDFTQLPQSNSSWVVGWLAPTISLTCIELLWIYKAVLPVFLTLVPVVLYFAFKKQIGEQRAFFATLFFMMVPVFNLEIAQIAKSMVAELLFALAILTMVTDFNGWVKAICVTILLGLTITAHYTIGLFALFYLFAILIVKIAIEPTKWRPFAIRKASMLAVILIAVICLGSGFLYYSYAIEGTMLGIIAQTAFDTSNYNITLSQSHDAFVRTGTGLDFLTVSWPGKLFRIIQYITQLLIITGLVALLFNYIEHRFTSEFIACTGASLVLLMICILFPDIPPVINMTRIYHMSLFFLAPMFILGGETICKGIKHV